MQTPFRRDYSRPILTGAEQARQGKAVKAAVGALSGSDAVRHFLNSYHPDLLGRPLDIAIASDTGLAAVESALSTASIFCPA